MKRDTDESAADPGVPAEDLERERICKAVSANEQETVREFLKNGGAAENIRDPGRRTLLHLAAFAGHCAMLKLLLESPRLVSLIDSRDRAEKTALHLAAGIGDGFCVRVLVAAGAKLTCQDKIGCTPLHLAVKFSKLYAVRALLELSADPTLEDKENQTPQNMAQASEDPEMISLMMSFAPTKPPSGLSVKRMLPAWMFPSKAEERTIPSIRVEPAVELSEELEAEDLEARDSSLEHKIKDMDQKIIHRAENLQLEESSGQRTENKVNLVSNEQVLCRGPGHIRCSHCYYTERFGRHVNCTRQCSIVGGSWGPLTCVPECGQTLHDTKPEVTNEARASFYRALEEHRK